MVLTKFTGSTVMDGSEDSLFKIVGTTMKHFASYVYLKALQAGESIRLRVYNKVDDVSHWKLDGDVTDSVGGNNGTVTNISSWVSQWKFDGNVNDSVGANNGTITYHTNLKRLYKFESNLNDSTGAAANGTLAAGTATYVTGQEGSAFSFDGSSYITASDTGLPTGTNVVSVSSWVYFPAFSGNQVITEYGNEVAGNSFLLLFDSTGKLNFSNRSTTTVISTTSLSVNTWYYITTVYNGTNALVYINGVLDKTTAITVNTTLGGANKLSLGAAGDGTSKITGRLDEFRYYNIALTQAQVSALYMNGKFAQSHTFDGGELITLANNVSNAQNTAFTISAWVKCPTLTTSPEIYNNITGGNGFLAYINSTGTLGFQFRWTSAGGGSTTTTGVSTVISDQNWHLVTWIYDGSANTTGLKFYVDGILDQTGSSASIGTFSISNKPIIGIDANLSSDVLTGQIDEMRYYNAALTASQVLGLYNYTGSNYITPLPVGNALSLDGSSYVTVNNQTPYNFERTNSFSSSFWIKTTTSSSQFLVSKDNGSATKGYQVNLLGGSNLEIRIINTASTNEIDVNTTGQSLNDGNWHNIIITYAGTSLASGLACYIDGVSKSLSVGTNNLSATIQNTNNLVIGASGTGTFAYTGLIDEVQIFNYVVSSAEINAINAGRFANTHQVGYWKFDGDLYDYSGQGSTGSPTGTMTYVTGALSGSYNVPNTHFNFDGSEYITVGTSATFNYEWTQPLTIYFWIRMTGTDAYVVINKGITGGGGKNWGLEIGDIAAGKCTFELFNNGSNYLRVTSNTAINDGLYHQMVITYDGSGKASGVAMYVDGAVVTTTTNSDTLALLTIINSNSPVIGARSQDFVAPLVAEIDDLRLITRALSSAEVSDLYTYPDSAMKVLVYDKTYTGVKSDAIYVPFLQGNQYMITAQQTSGTNRIVSFEREEVT